MHDQVGQSRAGRGEPGVLKSDSQLFPGQVVPAPDGFGQDPPAPGSGGGINPGPPVHARIALVKPRRG